MASPARRPAGSETRTVVLQGSACQRTAIGYRIGLVTLIQVEVLANAGVAGVGVPVEEPAIQVLHEAAHETSVHGGTHLFIIH